MDHLCSLIYNSMFLDFQWCSSQHYCHTVQAHIEISQVLQQDNHQMFAIHSSTVPVQVCHWKQWLH
jgi:hypothetical protein